MRTLLIAFGAALFLWQCTPPTPDDPAQSSPAGDENTVVASFDGGQDNVDDPDSQKNILQIAASSPDHTTLAAAVGAAELTTVLANNGPLTVFAPVNAAFDALPAGTVETLLLPENKSKLQEIITFHAAPGSYKVEDLKDGKTIFVATGHNLKIEVRDDGTYVHGAKILGTAFASNGIVHVVDKVLLPE
jgi:uncharacterized surface protein with fasciclin (FAS1) repeats